VGVHFCQLLQQLNICLSQIIPDRLFQILPWHIICPTSEACKMHNTCPSLLTYCQCFVELLCAYPGHTAVYTDGSFVRGFTGSTFIYDGQVFSYHSHICDKQCFCYWAAMFIQCQQWKGHLLHTDSLSALQNLSGYSPDNPIISRFCTRFPVFLRHWTLLCFAEYLATQACLGMSPLMWQPKQLLCMDPWHLIVLLAQMFISSIMLFHHRWKTNSWYFRFAW
jgi:hypothetical protein